MNQEAQKRGIVSIEQFLERVEDGRVRDALLRVLLLHQQTERALGELADALVAETTKDGGR